MHNNDTSHHTSHHSKTPSLYSHVLTEAQIESNRKVILALLGKVRRQGMDNVVHYLCQTTDFFNAPSSISGRHHNWCGGLAQHALEVYARLRELLPEGSLDEESIIISALFHDICKADYYRWSHHQKRWVRQPHPRAPRLPLCASAARRVPPAP